MTLTLEYLADGLREPFALEDVKFLPKSPINTNGVWKCLALPYADKRAYEDRLNDLAFGYWSTPATTPIVAGNKLIIPVTVVLCEVAHTDYGESPLSSQNRNGEVRAEENSATEAYSQGFRRACAQFRLGRYFYRLPKVWVPYDPAKRVIALSDEEKQRLVERLYREAGLLPALPTEARASTPASPPAAEQARTPAQHAGTRQTPQEADPSVQQQHLDWLKRYTQGNAAKQRALCSRFGVPALEQLRVSHFRAIVTEVQQARSTHEGRAS